jgi:menaquinone-9 beta-reductase
MHDCPILSLYPASNHWVPEAPAHFGRIERKGMAWATDVFVIGGGPAGLATGIAARGKGFRVMVADGAVPPIDKACGEGLLPDTLESLRGLGVSIGVEEGHALRGVRFVGAEHEATAMFPGASGIGLRRPVLHQRLIDRAAEVGVELLWKTPVTGISEDGVAAGGEVIRARWIVGADGIRSRVRKWSGMESGGLGTRRFAHRQHYRIAPWTDCVEVHWGERAQAYVTPVSGEEVGVVIVSRHAGLRGVTLGQEFPRLARQLGAAEVVTEERGAITATRALKKVYRGHVALVGDASGSVDAITGEGLHLGFRQAHALADALMTGNLREYERAHRRLGRRPAIMGRLMLLLDGRTALRERAIRVLAADEKLFERLLAAHAGGGSGAELASAGAMLGWRFVGA